VFPDPSLLQPVLKRSTSNFKQQLTQFVHPIRVCLMGLQVGMKIFRISATLNQLHNFPIAASGIVKRNYEFVINADRHLVPERLHVNSGNFFYATHKYRCSHTRQRLANLTFLLKHFVLVCPMASAVNSGAGLGAGVHECSASTAISPPSNEGAQLGTQLVA
jgi:hypothetical protein